MTGAWGLSFLIWRTELVKPFSMQAVRRDLVVWEGVGGAGRALGQGLGVLRPLALLWAQETPWNPSLLLTPHLGKPKPGVEAPGW